jgi:hypothetical protein
MSYWDCIGNHPFGFILQAAFFGFLGGFGSAAYADIRDYWKRPRP